MYIQHLGAVNYKALTEITNEERMTKYHVQVLLVLPLQAGLPPAAAASSAAGDGSGRGMRPGRCGHPAAATSLHPRALP